MHKYKIGIVELRLLSLVIILLCTLVKAIFYYRIKSKKKKQFNSFVKSFKSWYLDHNFHDSDLNISRQQFFYVSNIVNIFWYLSLVLLIVSTIMNSNNPAINN